MKNSTPDCPPFTRRQLDRLEELKAEIEKRDALSALDPKVLKINKMIDELSVKALRFTLKNIPKESLRPGKFLFVFNSTGEYAEIKPGFGDFHPDLPSWAKDHFIKWIMEQRAGLWRYDARDVLRETGIVAIETGMKRPIDLADIEHWELIKRRVLEIRGVKEEEILKNARTKKKRKRTRKNSATLDMVIDKLVEEKLLPKKITHQAFKKSLKKHLPDYSWDEV